MNREETFRAVNRADALQTALLRLTTAPAGETLVVVLDGAEVGRLGPRAG